MVPEDKVQEVASGVEEVAPEAEVKEIAPEEEQI